MNNRFTDRTMKIMQLANQEAQRYGNEYIGAEHLLLGLAIEGTGVGAFVLKKLDVDLLVVRREVEKLLCRGPGVSVERRPQTPTAKKVIEYALATSRDMNQDFVGSEHLLLGLLHERRSIAFAVLSSLGVTLDQAELEVEAILGIGTRRTDVPLPGVRPKHLRDVGENPVSFKSSATQFYGKTWIFVVQAIVCGGLASFSLLLGPMFLLGVMKRADGNPGTEAGIALTAIAVPLLLVTALAVFNILARRRPVVRLCYDGLQVNIIGAASLDGLPLLPGLVRMMWLVVSLQGYKRQILFAPWQVLYFAEVSGPPMAQTLKILGSFHSLTDTIPAPVKPVANQVAFPEVAFVVPLDQIADTINAYCQSPDLRAGLPNVADALLA